MRVTFTILGEPASKANSRKLVNFGKRPGIIKSDKARDFEKDALRQIPREHRVMMTGPVRVWMKIFYASERPDLDESVILDVLQARYRTVQKANGAAERVLVREGVYVNDRQVREKHIYHAIDRACPRVAIQVEAIEAQQPELTLEQTLFIERDPF